MNTRLLINLSLPALLVTGATVAVASARDAAADAKAAAQVAGKAGKALAKRDAATAIGWAEQAVALSPRDAGHRALLGQAYLQAGRFASARAMLEEAVQLDGRNGRAALSLVLAQIAGGDWAVARQTLAAHADKIAASDYGLAVALTGDPASAVQLLNQAAREPGAGPKTRQNLALALALAGQWQAAKVVAEADMSPGDVDNRMTEWAAFAQPRTASDQVAYLLGVAPVPDAGRPVALALSAPAAPVAVARAETPVAPVVAPSAAAAAPIATPGFAKVTFAPAREVVQALPVSTIQPGAQPVKMALSRAPQPLPATRRAVARDKPVAVPTRRGQWYVQLGAFDSPAVARDAWGRATRRFGAFQGHTPTGVNFSSARGSFYRLSVGGFTRIGAVGMCERYRAKGGSCFVRTGAGDQVAQWLRKPGVQLATRKA